MQTYYLLIDTETTGKWNLKLSPLDTRQPRMVQFAGMLIQRPNKVLSTINCIIKPKDFTIPPEVTAIHGISTERAADEGVSIEFPLTWVGSCIRHLDTDPILIGHNIDFDAFIVGGELYHNTHIATYNHFLTLSHRCTMKESTPICKLPGRYGDYKWPKLSEAFEFFTKTPLTGAHDALTDLNATLTVLNFIDQYNTNATENTH